MAASTEKPGSIAGIIVKDNLVFVAHRNPTGQMGNRWEFPGGKIEPGETQEEALHREFLEEFNCDIIIHQPICQAEFEHHGVKRGLFAWHISFAAENPQFTLTEHSGYDWVSIEKIEELAADSSFVDSDMLLYPEVKKYIQGLTA